MLDVRLITIIPTPTISQPHAAQGVTTQGAAIVPQLPNGSILSGFIVNRDPAGNPILRTETGDVVFSSNFFLKIGSEVVLRIQTNAGKQSAHLISVNGQSPEIAAGQSAFIDEPDVIVGRQSLPATTQPKTPLQTTAAPSTAAPTVQVGQTISAIIVTPSFTQGQPASVSPGTSLLLSVLGLNQQATPQPTTSGALSQLTSNLPANPATPGTTSSALASLLPAVPAPAVNTPHNAAAPATAPLTQAAVNTPQAAPSILSNQQAASADIAAPLGQTLVVTVAARNSDGSVSLSSSLGALRTANIGTIASGEQITLRVTSVATPNAYTLAIANDAAPLPPAPITELARNWSSLQQLTQLLGTDELSNLIPTIPTGATPTASLPGQITQSASQILFFISALKGGNFRDWLGGTHVKALEEKGYGALVRKAEAEFGQMARQFITAPPGEWQSAFIPILAAGELQQLRAFIKREKKKDEQGKPTGEEDTRFVLEMDLSQLGALQMDGLVKRREEKLQFDLMIRSRWPLPTELEKDIESIYQNTAELTGYHGQLKFQTSAGFPIHPLEELISDAGPDVLA